jgi:hypothetical protein
VHEQHLVGDAVAVEDPVGQGDRRPDDPEHDVVVEVQRDPPAHDVAGGLDPAGLRQSMAMDPVVGRLETHVADRLDPLGLGRWS